ncbi:MAG: glycoside hydrolase family 32 protein [Acidobacteria bacterium]|nr:glycoside hydrolase family 32 protein [Acidobacteriota bacterium]
MTRRTLLHLPIAAAGLAAAESPARYDEKLRPQFHFSPATGWTNDPNGLVFYKGQYHLFFQHNPFDVKWGNMTWGHAVSTDMVHWKQGDNVLLPDKLGTMFSGSAVVDWTNSSGFQTGEDKPIVLFYTAAGGTSPESKGQPFTQCIAYSSDGGKTFTKYAGNPVVPNIVGENRDPKVVWHAPTRRWVMVLFLDGNTYGFLTSPDLKKWTLFQKISIPKTSECPDFFEMPVENEPGVSKWVFTGANGNYLVGSVDGRRFEPEVMTQAVQEGANYYAVQTFSDLPGNRRVQMSWMSGGQYPGMPFSQQMSVPYEFRLRKHGYASYKIFATPIREVEALRGTPKTWSDVALKPGENPLAGIAGDGWDIVAEIDPGSAREVGFRLRGRTVTYRSNEKGRNNTLETGGKSAPLALNAGRVKLRILLDRSSIEIFGNDGELAMPFCFIPEDGAGLELLTTGGEAKVVSLKMYPMTSIWRA